MKTTHISLLIPALMCLLGCEGLDKRQFSGTQLGQLVTDVSKELGVKEQDAERFGNITRSATQATTGFRVEEELGIGQGVALSAFQRFGPLTRDQALLRYVNLVGAACVQTCDRPELPFKFAVIESDMVNAFAGPGGYVFITTGSLKLMKNEAELAGVLAHEIGHVTQKHSLKTIQRSKWAEAAFEIGGDKYKEKYGAIVDLATEALFTKGLDKSMEYEADRFGAEYAYLAGYNPAGLRDFLVTMKARQAGRSGGWFQTHPDTGDRIARLNSYISANMPGAKNYAVLRDRFQRECASRLR